MGGELGRESLFTGHHSEACQSTVVEVAAIKQSVNESVGFGDREMAQDAYDQLDGDAQFLLGTVLGSHETCNDGVVADTPGNVRLGIKEDLSMPDILACGSLEVLLVGGLVYGVVWKLDAVLLGESEEKLWLESAFNVEMLLNLWQGLEEAVNPRFAHC
ncbi:hypothetical protein HG531_012643 [Fusarium graminearum]|nr:hypothetical protein HG531_012643 [Fusarium graminearum]